MTIHYVVPTVQSTLEHARLSPDDTVIQPEESNGAAVAVKNTVPTD